MKQNKRDGSSLNYYLCLGQRYLLSWINTIDNEDIVLRTPHVLPYISLFTKSYQYKFHREKDDTDKDAAIFTERVKNNESNLKLINSIESSRQYGGRHYIYSEEEWNKEFGDYPKYEELIKRIKDRKKLLEKFEKEEKKSEQQQPLSQSEKDSV